MTEPFFLALPLAAGLIGGAMNALAGGGTFATLPALIAIGLPANVANATSAWAFRDELGRVGGVDHRLLVVLT